MIRVQWVRVRNRSSDGNAAHPPAKVIGRGHQHILLLAFLRKLRELPLILTVDLSGFGGRLHAQAARAHAGAQLVLCPDPEIDSSSEFHSI